MWISKVSRIVDRLYLSRNVFDTQLPRSENVDPCRDHLQRRLNAGSHDPSQIQAVFLIELLFLT